MSTSKTPLTGPVAESLMHRLTRRRFFTGGAAALVATGCCLG
jgi:hypothetical protein